MSSLNEATENLHPDPMRLDRNGHHCLESGHSPDSRSVASNQSNGDDRPSPADVETIKERRRAERGPGTATTKWLPLFFMACLAFAACVQCSESKPEHEPEPPANVLLISVDALRADHVGFMGYRRDITPTLDELARKGVVFDWAISQVPSTTSLFTMITGRELSELAGADYLKEGLHLDESVPALVSGFRKYGYRTAAIVNNPNLRAESGLARDFDYYNDFSESNLPEGKDSEAIAADTSEAAITWLSENSNDPFFLWLHYLDPHHPYDPPPPYDSMFVSEKLGVKDEAVSLRDRPVKDQTQFYEEIIAGRRKINEEQLYHIVGLYDGEIAYTDNEIGRVLEALKQSGRFENTIIVVTADHGEEFLDHGGMLHTYTLYDELIHIPLLLHMPGLLPEGRNIESQVRMIDIVPTIMDILGMPYPKNIRGTSFKSMALTGNGRSRAAVSEAPLLWYSLRTPEWKLIVDYRNGNKYLFNPHDDPEERTNLSDTKQSVSRKMSKQLDIEKRIAEVSNRAGKKALSDNVKEKLKALWLSPMNPSSNGFRKILGVVLEPPDSFHIRIQMWR